MTLASLSTQVSSRGVILRQNGGGLEIALKAVREENAWCFPKRSVFAEELLKSMERSLTSVTSRKRILNARR